MMQGYWFMAGFLAGAWLMLLICLNRIKRANRRALPWQMQDQPQCNLFAQLFGNAGAGAGKVEGEAPDGE